MQDEDYMRAALDQALISYAAGGVPVGAVLVEDRKIIAWGHNKRVQDGNPLAHGEMDCLAAARRRPRYDTTTLYTTLSPCMMCAGTIIQFGIKRLVIGENINFGGNIDFLRARGVAVTLLQYQACIDLMKRFIKEKPMLWDEDIAGHDIVHIFG